jgi:hypothetical protein
MWKEPEYLKYYFKINGVEIWSKAYDSYSQAIYFFNKEGQLHARFSDCEKNYDWKKCAKLFGDEK